MNFDIINIMINSSKRTKTKTYNSLPYYFYTEQVFSNNFNELYNSLKNYYCPIKTQLIMKGLYLAHIFSYYEITAKVMSKEVDIIHKL